MTLARFLNALKILRSVDLGELQEAGVTNGAFIKRFLYDPYRALMSADDADKEKVWAIVESRQPKERT